MLLIKDFIKITVYFFCIFSVTSIIFNNIPYCFYFADIFKRLL